MQVNAFMSYISYIDIWWCLLALITISNLCDMLSFKLLTQKSKQLSHDSEIDYSSIEIRLLKTETETLYW